MPFLPCHFAPGRLALSKNTVFTPKAFFWQRKVTFEIELFTGMKKMHFLIKKSYFFWFYEEQIGPKMMLHFYVWLVTCQFSKRRRKFLKVENARNF